MNLILLFDDDFIEEGSSVSRSLGSSGDGWARGTEDPRNRGTGLVRLTGRRLDHVKNVHRAAVGDELVIGVAGDKIGTGIVTRLDDSALEMRVALHSDPPKPLPLTLILALPRPKVLNRVLASVTSLGVKRIHLINAWRVEKSYWKSPKLSEDNLRMQCIIGLEQAKDTILPKIELHRFFRPFVENFASDSLNLVAHPGAREECPRGVERAVTLAIGPEGGFIEEEIASLERAGFTAVSLGPRILRVETAVACLIGRLY